MEAELPLPIVSVREILPVLGFIPVWGTATDLEPAYAFKGGGIDIRAAQVTSVFLRPEFLVGGTAANGQTLKYIEQSMPLAVESSDQVAAWLAFAVGIGFKPLAAVDWFERGRGLQHLLPWERRRLELRIQAEETARLRMMRPHCTVVREDLRHLLKLGTQMAGWPPAPGRFVLSFDGEMLKLRARGRLVGVEASGAAWSHAYAGDLYDLHKLPKRLDEDPVEVGIWHDLLEIGRVRVPVAKIAASLGDSAGAWTDS